MKTPIDQVWLDDDTFIVFFGEIRTEEEDGETIITKREAEYWLDEDHTVVIDCFWDGDDNFLNGIGIDPETLKYILGNDELGEDAPITREEYDEIVKYVKETALKSIKD